MTSETNDDNSVAQVSYDFTMACGPDPTDLQRSVIDILEHVAGTAGEGPELKVWGSSTNGGRDVVEFVDKRVAEWWRNSAGVLKQTHAVQNSTIEMLRAENNRIQTQLAECKTALRDYEDVIACKRRLTRELDVILNGEGAARQASLCDIVGQAANGGLPAQKDSKRLDWLEMQYVIVRTPLAFGSRECFAAYSHNERDEDPRPSNLRMQIDAIAE